MSKVRISAGPGSLEMCRRESFLVLLMFASNSWHSCLVKASPILRLIVSWLSFASCVSCPCGIFLLWHQSCWIMLKLLQSCPTLCNTMDYSLPDSSMGFLPGKNPGVVAMLLLLIFSTQGSNLSYL